MHAIGLHGKSFIPMLLGFGCNVPAIYATRTLETPRDKTLTALLIPLMSCGARLPVYALFVGVFFASHAGTVIWSLYVLGIILAIVMGLIFKKTLFRGETPVFIMELPPYRLPSFKSLCLHTWEKGKHFLVKAGTFILAFSIVMWFLINLPWGVHNQADSYLGKTGRVIAPIVEPLGFGNWQAASSLLSGLMAKEIVVGTMGEIYAPHGNAAHDQAPPPSFGSQLKGIGSSFVGAVRQAVANVTSTFGIASLSLGGMAGSSSLTTAVRHNFTPLAAFAFMVFVLIYPPCIPAALAIAQELGSWKWFGISFFYQIVLAWGMAFIVYQGGRLLGLGG